MKADIVVDLQFGSTGKGLFCGVLAASDKYDTVVASNMPNAGHTTIKADGRKWINKAMPNGVEVGRTILMGPGSVFSPQQLAKEVAHLNSMGLLKNKQILIHEAAGVLLPEHAEAERASLSRISSTMQGSAEALIAKIRRQPDAIAGRHAHTIASAMIEVDALKHDDSVDIRLVGQAEYLATLTGSKRVLVEGSQGYSLGISSGFYPYCTSRECTASRVAADCLVPIKSINKVYGVARVHPIRVGNTADGYSGDIYPDQEELTWEGLGQTPELTTVTQRVRRVFTFSYEQIRQAILANGVDEIFLNFANYDTAKAAEIVRAINYSTTYGNALVHKIGVGPKENDILPVQEFMQKYGE